MPPVTAAREVEEETGFRAAIGRCLTTVSYKANGGPKTVQYFAARRMGGIFTPNKEVDRLEWLPAAKAAERMTYEFDQAVLSTFSLEPAALTGVVLVRHAQGGPPRGLRRTGRDCDRWTRRAAGRPRRWSVNSACSLPSAVRSAPLERCRGTVAPLAGSLGQDVHVEPVLAEDAYRDDPAGARRRLVELASSRGRRAAASSSAVRAG